MKKIVLALLNLVILNSSLAAYAYCPTPEEYRSKLNEFQAQMLKMLNSENFNNLDPLTTMQEQYINSIFPACITYFQSVNNTYDCKKLQTLATSYIILDSNDKPAGKSKIDNLPEQVKQKCSIEYKTLHFMIDD